MHSQCYCFILVGFDLRLFGLFEPVLALYPLLILCLITLQGGNLDRYQRLLPRDRCSRISIKSVDFQLVSGVGEILAMMVDSLQARVDQQYQHCLDCFA